MIVSSRHERRSFLSSRAALTRATQAEVYHTPLVRGVMTIVLVMPVVVMVPVLGVMLTVVRISLTMRCAV